MKALEEIGLKKAFRFGISIFQGIIFKFMIFPQLRVPFLRLMGAQIGKNTIISPLRFFNIYRKGFPALRIGDNCFIGDEVLLDLAADIVLEDHVTLAERVTILTHLNVGYVDHPLQKHFPSTEAPVRFERGSFVGTNVTVLHGVTVGEEAFVAAGSVVREDVPPRTLVAGVPAQVIRTFE